MFVIMVCGDECYRRMNRVRIVISYNGRWEQLPNGSQRFVGSDNQGMYVSKNMSYEELVSIVHTVVKYDVNKYNVDLQSISIVPGATCRTFVRNDDDVQFMLGEDRVIPQVCVSLIERVTGDMIRNYIPAPENTQPFGSASGSNQVFTQRSATEDHVENTDEDHVQIQRRGRRVEGVSCTGADIPGTSEVRHNVSADDSDNTTTWVIPGANSYSFGIGRSTTLVAEEPISMIYKGQFFPTKKDLKRLVGLFTMRRNFEWKVKRSNNTTLHLVCLIEKCTWKLRAVRRDEGTYFQVRSFVNEHSCPLEEIHRRHRQASAVIIGEVVAPRLQ
ncbi:hypothetical protein Dsin_017063 [Dipteronia sinensis]|uniref:Transposase MuDR plant domain-containing protein n=1 Tax=Dipteronia sinensis TaxID=43782 RepID=A0AAE0AFL5_9ROSI|nr:hypothetical protein Dsin_017063 [Dipteronia sinensis]